MARVYAAFDHCIERFIQKYPKAMACLAEDEDSILIFNDYPAKTGSVSERLIRLNQYLLRQAEDSQNKKPRQQDSNINHGVQTDGTARKKWFRLRSYKPLATVVGRVKFVGGIKQNEAQKQTAA